MKIRKVSKSRVEVEKDCEEWAKEISKSYKPDLIVFIAKSGFLFTPPMANVFGCDYVDIIASRPKSNSKDKIKKIIKLIPKKLVLTIVSSSFMYKFNEKKKERNVIVSNSLNKLVNGESVDKYKEILIVDDSVDTGWTILAVKNKLEELFPHSNIKTASYIVIDISKKRVNVDYYREKNAVVLTATSRNSIEYEKFVDDYENWSKNYATN